ncbi:hypothetical protein ACIQVT_02405 [Streptomyces sp. NPDC100445]|uniref:hypothetical protein n=1 Tax=Streptomyces sp. NPDC100445 TaxID=3366102 RepID=UPI0037FFD4D5
MLERDEDDAVLVLLGGRVEVVDGAGTEPGRGAMTVVSRRELVERLDAQGSGPGSGDLDAVAAALDTMVTHQGG